MLVYLPIAELPVNVLLMLAMGGAVGFLSGMFGVGGGFLMTPMLIFAGVPSAVAVATGANPLIASSITGTIAQYRLKNVDVKLGMYLLAGGAAGAFLGVRIVKFLRQAGQFDLSVSLLYVVFMGVVGGIMLVESIRAIRKQRQGRPVSMRRPAQHNWVHRLPFKTRFKTSKLYISAVPAIALGVMVGLLSGVMGVGGGFIMVPILIYLLRVPTNIAIGTSLFQVIFVSAITTVFQAVWNQTVDIALALMLMAGGVLGAQAGASAGQRLRAEQLRLLLAILVLAVGLRLAVGLLVPSDLFSLARAGA
ncbi:MAG: sulfite exporter TauE/SafE family protein [Rhodomicrobium sp.]|nr:sulfite exporter TauE/SafE family protein [Rhodomicrobium sp.]